MTTRARLRGRAALPAAVLLAAAAACMPGGDPAPSPGRSPAGPAAPAATPTSTSSAAPAAVRAPDAAWTDHGAVAPDAYAPGYAGTVGPITPELAARMSSSWRAGCPVPLADLRYVTVTYRDVGGGAATGELVVHADVADSVVAVFGELFALGYPIRSMRPVDDFGGSDDASMAADNTSAFNCRPISRGTGWSEHAYGRAIDLNPVENPYVRGSLVLPPEGEPFAARPDAPGVLHAGDAVVRAFAAHGWRWGGEWASPVDYQHFSTTGR
ncbi:M15 family metallopeptidase [Cellulosimicrobium cellulans]|uniref:M15 family metallopeptidase n=1 Tax=Cellulosimicrobium cellulans TaxID=1710 RepID=UPI0021CB27C8|nr:M15 family metallopeptidase [Cellulosimicrobium cellulans]